MLDSITFFRVIKNGTLGFWRNSWLSVASTLVLTVTLIILSVLGMLYGITSYTVKTVKERVDVSVYFKTTATEPNILKIRDELAKNDLINEINYISAEQALKDFKESRKNDAEILMALEELSQNPLQATLHVKAKELAFYPQIAESLNQEKYKAYIEKANFEDNRKVIERLGKTLDFIVAGGLALAIIFSVIAILVIFNTIALTIYNRREEIEIMRLVGATNWYIRGPFLVEVVLYSLIATAITAGAFIPVFGKIMPQVMQYVGSGFVNLEAFSTQAKVLGLPIFNFWVLLGLQFAVAVFLTMVSSYMAMRKHLKI